MKRWIWILAVCVSAAAVGSNSGDERLKGIACRSVHLQYPAVEGELFYNEVTIEKSADGTYFCVCGFSKGYYGIQELANGKKLVIFSVWDPGSQDDPKKVPEEKRVQLLHQDPGVRVGRFGNEGTGGQSFFDYDWKIGTTYRFLVTSKVAKERTAYGAYFYLPEKNQWKHLVTFSTLANGHALRGCYSFIEDFRRNKISTTKVRHAVFANGAIKAKGEWIALEKARFTADSNPVLNINAGIVGNQFFLTTGGETKNDGTPLRQLMTRPKSQVPMLPELMGL